MVPLREAVVPPVLAFSVAPAPAQVQPPPGVRPLGMPPPVSWPVRPPVVESPRRWAKVAWRWPSPGLGMYVCLSR
jgi:hypothetical protein